MFAARAQTEDDLCLPLQYLIGRDDPPGKTGYITMCSYDTTRAPSKGVAAYYLNAFVERGKLPQYAPYLNTSDTAKEYDEGMPDPNYEGFNRNLHDQAKRIKKLGARYVELDNRDAYTNAVILKAYDLLFFGYDLRIICKNPGMSDHDEPSAPLLRHPAVVGAIIERGKVRPLAMSIMRIAADKPEMPCWFVNYGANGAIFADECATEIKKNDLRCMGVSLSYGGEYTNHIDVLMPRKQ